MSPISMGICFEIFLSLNQFRLFNHESRNGFNSKCMGRLTPQLCFSAHGAAEDNLYVSVEEGIWVTRSPSVSFSIVANDFILRKRTKGQSGTILVSSHNLTT